MSEISKELPEGWKWKKMEDISNIIGGGTPKSKENTFYDNGLVPWLTPADLSGYKEKYISKGKRNITELGLNSSSARMVPAGTVLFTSRAPIGYVVIASNEVCTNQGFKSFVIKNEDILPDYVYWWLKGNKPLAESFASGTTFLELSGAKAKILPIPIAPFEQQKQIVAKIEQLFSHIDSGIESLNTAKQRLKQYRQSVLKAAVTGELTKEWREAQQNIGCAEERSASIPHAQDALPIVSTSYESADKLLERILQTRRQKWEEQQLEQFKAKGKLPKNDKWKEKYKEPKASVMHMDLKIPKEWKAASIDQVAEVFLGKMLDKSKHITGERLPYLRNINVRWGRIDTNDLLEMFFKESELKRFEVIVGDVLVCEGGEPGRAAVWEDSNTIKYQKALHRVRFYLPILPQYLVYLLEYFASTGLLARYFTGSTIKHFTKESFLTLPFPLPSLIEMQQIISIVDEKVYSVHRLENEIETQLQKAQKTKQSILASAFSGKLTNL